MASRPPIKSPKMQSHLCEKCSRPIPIDDPRLELRPLERRIYDLVSPRDVAPDILCMALYGADPPAAAALKTIEVTIGQMNKRLRTWGQTIEKRVPRKRGQPWALKYLGEAAA
jgi:hypothetical protein